jgi:hypothetical protein
MNAKGGIHQQANSQRRLDKIDGSLSLKQTHSKILSMFF